MTAETQKPLHYSDCAINQLVENHGWTLINQNLVQKKFKNVAPVGQLSDGSRIYFAEFDDRGRYLTIHAGFNILFDIDCRDLDADEIAIMVEQKMKEKVYS